MLRECWQCSGAGTLLRYFRGWQEVDRTTYEQLKARSDLARSAHEPIAREFPCPCCKGSGQMTIVLDRSLSFLRPREIALEQPAAQSSAIDTPSDAAGATQI